MKTFKFLTALVLSSIVVIASCKKEEILQTPKATIPLQPNYQPAVRLGFAQNFAVLTPSSAINNGYTNIYGDLGISSGNEFLGFPKDAVQGNLEINTPLAIDAHNDLIIAYHNVYNREAIDMVTLSGNLGNLILTPGLYATSSTRISSGNLTFDARGDETATFIIKVTNNFSTNANTKVILKNNARASNIFWLVTGNVILEEFSTFCGTLIVNRSIYLANGVRVDGRLLSVNGAVELNANIIGVPDSNY